MVLMNALQDEVYRLGIYKIEMIKAANFNLVINVFCSGVLLGSVLRLAIVRKQLTVNGVVGENGPHAQDLALLVSPTLSAIVITRRKN